MDYIIIGRIVRPHGIDGTLKVLPLTDFPERFKALESLYVIKGEGIENVSLERVRFQKGYVLLKLKKCSDLTEARKWAGAEIGICAENLWPLEKGEYYHFQIIGLQVITQDGEDLGQIEDIFPTGSNDVFVVRRGEREILLPAIKEVVKEVDLERRVMVVHLLEGLLD